MRWIGLFTSVFLFCAAAAAEDKIVSFGAEVIVQKSGDAVITETIAVALDGHAPRFGITRTLPRRILGPDGIVKRILRDVNFVFRDSVKEKFEVELQDEGDVIRVGDGARKLPAGVYTFTLQYIAHGIVMQGKTADGFRIPLPGKWSWPVDRTNIVFRFPEYMLPASVAVVAQPISYGRPPDSSEMLRPEVASDAISVQYDKRLLADQSLWIAVSMPRGFFESQ